MLIVRCTAKPLTRLKVRPKAASTSSTTRFGDWYATILPVWPAHLVLLVSEGTRLAVLLPACEISTLSKRIPEAILELCGSSVRQRSFWSPVAAGVEATHDAGVVHRDLKPGLAAVDHRSHAQDHLAVTRDQNDSYTPWFGAAPPLTVHSLPSQERLILDVQLNNGESDDRDHRRDERDQPHLLDHLQESRRIDPFLPRRHRFCGG